MCITASKLYDYIQCEHRVWRDIHGPKEERAKENNTFVELLWQKGTQHEEKIISQINMIVDISTGTTDERIQKTLAAMEDQTPLIYQGVLKYENLFGIPDLLRRLSDGNYIAIDIKSGRGMESIDEDECNEVRPKKHYAIQLCLYTEILNKLGFSKLKRGIILDIQGNEIDYDLMAPQGPRTPQTWWELYEEVKQRVESLIKNNVRNKPAMSGSCKLCHWDNSCKKWCDENNDLSNIFSLGRKARDIINKDLHIERINDFLKLDIDNLMIKKKENKTFLKGIGEKSLKKYFKRASILINVKKPVIYSPIEFPKVSHELFFDIEDDPTQDFVYMHGIYERSGKNEKYLHFTAKELSRIAEKEAWAKFWEYIYSLPKNDFSVYYYSHHEKTTYKKLQQQYPDVISMKEVESFFENANVIDLFNIVQKNTDWPITNYSLKALATFLGFNWRDLTPSGALSIQWFNHYMESKDESTLKRILEYNEDDCKATMVLKDALEKL